MNSHRILIDLLRGGEFDRANWLKSYMRMLTLASTDRVKETEELVLDWENDIPGYPLRFSVGT